MSSRKQYILELIAGITGDKPMADMIVERLQEEGLLVLGYGDKDVDQIVVKFSETFGTTKVSKYDRFAADRLAKKYGSQSICGIIQLLAEHSGEKYAPVVGSITQLEEKIVSVIHFLRHLDKGSEEIKI